MIAYFGIYSVTLIMAICSNKFSQNSRHALWTSFIVILILLIGFRYEVGGDWDTYLQFYEAAIGLSLKRAILIGSDFGYYFFNWLLANSGLGIWSLNLLCAAITVSGIAAIAQRQPLPWIALSVAAPYMLTVVAMGYTRQAAALGLICWALTAVQDRRPWLFLFFVVLATTFHKSAVIAVPAFIFTLQRIRFYHIIMLLLAGAGIFRVFVFDTLESQWTNYVLSQKESDGAAIRSAMNFIPALILIMWRKQLRLDGSETRHWFWMAILSLVLPFIIPFASTAVDRMALYLLPLQMIVFSRIFLLAKSISVRSFFALLVLIYYLFVLIVWLNFSTHADSWIPYQFYPTAQKL